MTKVFGVLYLCGVLCFLNRDVDQILRVMPEMINPKPRVAKNMGSFGVLGKMIVIPAARRRNVKK